MKKTLIAGGALIAAATLGAAVPASASTSAVPVATWGNSQEVPGTAALNTGGNAAVSTVSCGAAGNCIAAGSYTDGAGHTQGFLAAEKNGDWKKAIEVPGLAALNTGGDASVNSVSCVSKGNCSAAGGYVDGTGATEGYVASEAGGTWGGAEPVPGLAALNVGGNASVNTLSCGAAGNCIAAGSYTDGAGHTQGFLAAEKNGDWKKAIEVPGLAALNTGGHASVNSVSCASKGNCSAGGDYAGNPHGRQAFVVDETNGIWGKAKTVPGSKALNADDDGTVNSLSCASAGNCTLGGFVSGGCGCVEGPQLAFVDTEANGTWGTAQQAAGNLDNGEQGSVNSVSCAAAGDCSAGGTYGDGTQTGCCNQAFVVTQAKGTWGAAQEVPGTKARRFNGGFNAVRSVSCAAPGDCSAAGFYLPGAFVVTESNGTWGTAKTVHAPFGQTGGASLRAVSCGSPGNCSAGGSYVDGSGHTQALVIDETSS